MWICALIPNYSPSRWRIECMCFHCEIKWQDIPMTEVVLQILITLRIGIDTYPSLSNIYQHRQRFILRLWEEILVKVFFEHLKRKNWRNRTEFFLPVVEESCTRNTRLRWGAGENHANIAPSMSGLVDVWPAHLLNFCISYFFPSLLPFLIWFPKIGAL